MFFLEKKFHLYDKRQGPCFTESHQNSCSILYTYHPEIYCRYICFYQLVELSHLCGYYSDSFYFVVFYYLGKDAIYTIPVKNILAVEKLEESSFNKKNVSCINIEAF